MHKYFHQIAMWLILLGSLILFYLGFVWLGRGNAIMSIGMFVMGMIALSNFYLHRMMMKKNRKE